MSFLELVLSVPFIVLNTVSERQEGHPPAIDLLKLSPKVLIRESLPNSGKESQLNTKQMDVLCTDL